MVRDAIFTTHKSLAATLAQVGRLDQHLTAELGILEEGWFLATDLLQAEAPYLEEGLARSVARYPGAERRVAGAFFIGHYAWYVAAAAIACYLAERRVPDLSPANVALRYSTFTWEEDGETGEGERLDVRFLSEGFAALPGDSATNCPVTVILPDEAALRDWLRLRLEEHLRPLIELLYRRTRLGKPAQWALVADSCAALFLYAGQNLGDAVRGCAEGLAFVKSAGSPLYNRQTNYITLEYQGHCETFRARGGCCLYYRVEPGHNCSTCVLRPEAERKQRLLDYMARKHAQPALVEA